MTGSTFSTNEASNDGGAVDSADTGTGNVTVTAGSGFSSDTAGNDGGAIDSADSGTGNLTVSGSTFGSDTAGNDGGAVASATNGSGTLAVASSTFNTNSSSNDGGAVDNADGGTGNATVTGSTFTANAAFNDGGAIDNADVGTGNLTATGLTFTSDTAGANGGAVDHADDGAGTASVGTSTFTSDTAADDGGAIDSGDDRSSGPVALVVTSSSLVGDAAAQFDGGAIDSGDGGTGTITASISGSTFAQDAAGSDGGAIDNGDGATVPSVLTVADSTLTANSAPDGDGGAIDNGDQSGTASAIVSSTTISANTAESAPGIDDAGGTGTVDAAADLLADACAQGASGWTDAGYSAGDATCLAGGPGSVASTTVGTLLGPLAANGGATKTLLPQAGNAGIGRIPTPTTVVLGTSHVTLCPTSDQRGVASLSGVDCSAGSVQVSPPAITSAAHATFTSGAPGSYAIHATGLPAPTYSEIGALPSGVSLNPTTGVLSGTAHGSGTFPVTITALNSSGSAHQAFTLTVQSATQSQGYWLVGGDGGIFTFGSAAFYGSMGSTPLQRPVVAITPTADRHGYWLVASDGGIFGSATPGSTGPSPASAWRPPGARAGSSS